LIEQARLVAAQEFEAQADGTRRRVFAVFSVRTWLTLLAAFALPSLRSHFAGRSSLASFAARPAFTLFALFPARSAFALLALFTAWSAFTLGALGPGCALWASRSGGAVVTGTAPNSQTEHPRKHARPNTRMQFHDATPPLDFELALTVQRARMTRQRIVGVNASSRCDRNALLRSREQKIRTREGLRLPCL
jgi:hypothetical protein